MLCLAGCLELAIACARAVFRGNPTMVYFAAVGTVLLFAMVAVPLVQSR